MKRHENFWDRNARFYEYFMRKDRKVYEKLYELIRPIVKDKEVLELATGTGMIANNTVHTAKYIEATGASARMIAEAKRNSCPIKLNFSVQDIFDLPYTSQTFDVVIVANALHIVQQPKKALAEIRRVLKDDGGTL